MINIPQTLSTETADALNALIRESDRFRDRNAPEIQELIRAIQKLQKVDAREAFVRFGAVAAICGDVDGVFEYYKKALLLPDAPETKHEFWVSLANIGLYSKAREIGSWLLEPKRGFFQRVWERAVAMGHVIEVWDRLSEAKKTYPDLCQVDFSRVGNAAAVMGAHGLSDKDIVSVFDLVGETLRAHRTMFSGQLVSILRVMRPTDDPAYLYFAIPVEAGVDEIHTMNRELASLVVERLHEGIFPQGMVVSFTKAYPIELRVAA